MTNKEVQDKIKRAKEKDWFKTIKATFLFEHIEEGFDKIGFFDIYQYIKRECREWEKIEFELPIQFARSRDDFNTLKVNLEVFIDNYIEHEESGLNNQWNSIENKIIQLNSNKRFPLNNPVTKFLIEVHKKGSSYFSGAFSYFFENNNLNIRTREAFVGAIMAYEYQFEDGSQLPKRRNSEKSSNTRIRNDFEKLFTENTKKVNKFIEEVKAKSRKHSKEVIQTISEKKEEYEKWVEECKKNDQVYTKQSLDRAKELETLYSANLQVAAPADHWKERAEDMKKEGDIWRIWFIGSILLGVITLVSIIAIISNKAIEDLFSTTGNAIRFSIIFITLVSLLVYGVRSFAKLMFSSYHLRRDAQERKQLAYFYLSLIEYKAVDDADRHLIIQSLFSRADSGLLKDDSGPVMPTNGGILDKFMGTK